MVSVIIPAHNEAETIVPIIKTALSHPAVSEVIVVDDASSDDTATLAQSNGARVIRLTDNQGKASAMNIGVAEAREDIICFLDADIIGFTPAILEKILRPVIHGDYAMFIGLRGRNTYILNKILRIFPIIGGERALRKELWALVPEEYKKNFQIEIALNYYAKQRGYHMGFDVMPNLSHVIKEKKWGFWLGLKRRLMMNADLVVISIRLYVIETLRIFFRLRKRPAPSYKKNAP